MQEKMINESGGLFFQEIFDQTVPFVAKLPSNIIKAIYEGCNIKLYLGLERIESSNSKRLTVGMEIADDKEHPFMIFHTVNNTEELQSIYKAFQQLENKLYLFDELTRNVLSGKLTLLEKNKEINKELLFSIETNFNVKEKIETENRFITYMEELFSGNTKLPIDLIIVKTKFIPSGPTKVIDLDVGETILSQSDEGQGLELSIHSLLNSYYHETCHHSPQIIKKDKMRELTDILVFKESHLIFIESKVSQVLNREKELNSKRLITNIHKNIDKAIKQLRGAVKSVNTKQKVYTSENNLIDLTLNNDIPNHCIVLISEMRHELDWDKLYQEIIGFGAEESGLLHILDLTELFKLLFLSKTPEAFNRSLVNRWKIVYEHQTPLVRIEFRDSK